MKYPTIHIEGSILSADILDKIEQGDIPGQKPKDFWLNGSGSKVKDEIVKAWADAKDYWKIYKRKIDSLPGTKSGTSETRNLWMAPLMSLLGYDIQLNRTAQVINSKSYAVSHNAANLDGFPTHIMGFNDSLDKKRQDSGPRMSPHALVQEYINLNEQYLYALVTNGLSIRLLRDSSRLIKLSYLEFDLERMFKEDHFTDFAILFRLLHASRMPQRQGEGADSIIEEYHQNSLDSGSRIRDGLSRAVEHSIISVANGFLQHYSNIELRQNIKDGALDSEEFYRYLLNFIYRLLFLMVIEERDLIFEEEISKDKRDIYYSYYSVSRIRNLSERRYLAEVKHHDLWVSLKNSFLLFDISHYGEKLGIKPLAGELFTSSSIGNLYDCELDNKTLLECLRNLSVFENPITGQMMRVNYGALNVEEFGSVYEGLLEYDPYLDVIDSNITFGFAKGDSRKSSGSHYTPDELVQPLIQHSLDYIIEEKLKHPDPEKALLSITVCDVACGSGHILLNAARRIANDLAKVRTGEDQPSPAAFRQAVRDVIQHCIYGVDKNPLAVELAKVALWLEAHNPGQPLNFLDHHIKCGDAIVGLAHKEELQNGIPDEAFKTLPGDDKDIAKELRDQNRAERKAADKIKGIYEMLNQGVVDITRIYHALDRMPETTPEEIEAKRAKYEEIIAGKNYLNFKILADIMTAQFFIPKTVDNYRKLITNARYSDYLRGEQPIGEAPAKAMAISQSNRFFHWFLEFPEIFSKGGFDCILGNPPFLGGQKLTGTFGNSYCEYIRFSFAPIGSVDLVTYFFRRVFTLIQNNCFQALISTNTIAQGSAREGGLSIIKQQGGTINFAVRSMKWPGLAAVEVSLIAVHKGEWCRDYVLDNKKVKNITTYLDDTEDIGDPYRLQQNANKSFQGSIVLGKGFVLTPEKASQLISRNPTNKDVLFPYLIGDDLNSRVDQSPSRWVINFFDWDKDYCRNNYPDCFEILEREVKPERTRCNKDKEGQDIVGDYKLRKPLPQKWWIYAEKRPALYRTIKPLERVMVNSLVSKYATFCFQNTKIVFSHRCAVFPVAEAFSALLLSSLHSEWVYKYTSTLGSSTINYSPTDCFQNFPFPQDPSSETESRLELIGKEYHKFRRDLMLKLQLGLTKTYNQFHNNRLSSEIADGSELPSKEMEKRFGKDTIYLWKHLQKTPGTCSMEEAVEGIEKLRDLHKKMDEAVLKAYGWHIDSEAGPAINLEHDFYEVDYLPENDRIRYSISPEARKEVLKRLLLLNHKIYEEEVKQGFHNKGNNKRLSSKNKKTIDGIKESSQPYTTSSSPKQKQDKDQISFLDALYEPNTRKSTESGELIKDFRSGQRVFHHNFGQGTILTVEGTGFSAKLTVKFTNETKLLIAGYAKLQEDKEDI
jgi:hypothetical protein